MEVVLIVIAVFAVGFIYYTIKEKAKRNIFFKGQYEEQKKYTHRSTIITAHAPLTAVRQAIIQKFPVDKSIGAQIKGGNYELLTDTPTKLVYKRNSKITTGGGGDEFTVGITFKEQGDGALRIVANTQSWKEKDGVTRRAGIDAMRTFYDDVIAAVTSVDPNATVEYSDGSVMPRQNANTPNAKTANPAVIAQSKASGSLNSTTVNKPRSAYPKNMSKPPTLKSSTIGTKKSPTGNIQSTHVVNDSNSTNGNKISAAQTSSAPHFGHTENTNDKSSDSERKREHNFCGYCGKALVPNAKFCPDCGHAVN